MSYSFTRVTVPPLNAGCTAFTSAPASTPRAALFRTQLNSLRGYMRETGGERAKHISGSIRNLQRRDKVTSGSYDWRLLASRAKRSVNMHPAWLSKGESWKLKRLRWTASTHELLASQFSGCIVNAMQSFDAKVRGSVEETGAQCHRNHLIREGSLSVDSRAASTPVENNGRMFDPPVRRVHVVSRTLTAKSYKLPAQLAPERGLQRKLHSARWDCRESAPRHLGPPEMADLSGTSASFTSWSTSCISLARRRERGQTLLTHGGLSA